MSSPYPLLPGMLFREDFISRDMVIANKGIITSTPNINKGITILTANTDKVTYNLPMNRSAVNTIVFNVNLRDVTNPSWLLRKGDSSVAPSPGILIMINGGVLYSFFNSVSTNEGHCSITTGKHSIIVSYNGAGAANADKLKIYIDGVLKTLAFTDSIPTELSWQMAGVLGIFGRGTSAQGAVGNKMLHAGIFNYAFAQDDVTYYHNMLQGIK